MLTTTRASHFGILGALLLAAATADADPHRLVVQQLDGERAISDAADRALRDALEDYDTVSPKRWKEAEQKARKTASGPAALRQAARDTDTAAIVGGYVEERGRHTVLTVTIVDVTGGHELDSIEVKIGENGISAKEAQKLKDGLKERLSWIPAVEPAKPVYDKVNLGGAKTKTKSPPVTQDDEGEKAPAKGSTEVATRDDGNGMVKRCYDVFGDCPKSLDPTPEPPHVPVRTKIGRVQIGGFVDSRSLLFESESTDTQQYSGVAGKGLTLGAEFYPWPLKKYDGQLSGFGISLGISKSAGAVSGIDTEDSIGDYVIDSSVVMGALHWRQPVSDLVAIDSEVGYSRHDYTIEDPPMELEIPDTTYSAVHLGAHVDLAVAPKATVGFGFRYFYVTDGAGNLNDQNTFGSGVTSGYSFDASFVIPLPKDLFVKGVVEYKRFTTELDGSGDITDMDGVRSATDSTMTGSLAIGKSF